MTSSQNLMSIGASLDVDRSVTRTDRQTDRQTHEHGFGKGSYTIAPKGAINITNYQTNHALRTLFSHKY